MYWPSPYKEFFFFFFLLQLFHPRLVNIHRHHKTPTMYIYPKPLLNLKPTKFGDFKCMNVIFSVRLNNMPGLSMPILLHVCVKFDISDYIFGVLKKTYVIITWLLISWNETWRLTLKRERCIWLVEGWLRILCFIWAMRIPHCAIGKSELGYSTIIVMCRGLR